MPDRICIIGAGISGIAAVRALQKTGLPFVCFEAGSEPGGLWNFRNDNGMSKIYQSLHMNTSRDRSSFSDLPMPDDYPDFPHHTLVLDYLQEYINRFDLRPFIRFRHSVESVSPIEGGYSVTYQDDSGMIHLEQFGAVVVASGHLWVPHIPAIKGNFEGEVLHSSAYSDPSLFDGKSVLIVGAGNSACDIACELAGRAKHIALSTRSGAHIIPKYILGKPVDQWTSPFMSRLPLFVQRGLFGCLLFAARGRQTNYGFPQPSHRLGSAHPTISNNLLALVGHGQIMVKPDIEFAEGSEVRFKDGTIDTYDSIILATGFTTSFPFLASETVTVRDNTLELYHHVVSPSNRNLYFIGLVQPLGALAPLAEVQSEWVANLLIGLAQLPSTEAMLSSIRKDELETGRRYVASRRHTMEVDFFVYRKRVLAASRRTARS